MRPSIIPWISVLGQTVYRAVAPDRSAVSRSGYASLRGVVIVAGLGSLAVAGVRGFPKLARLWPIAAMIVVGYAIAIPFRTWQSYAGLVTWNRYQLIPQLGLSLLIAGLLGDVPGLRGRISHSLFWFLAGLVLWTELQTGVVFAVWLRCFDVGFV